jgi:hypothetical protein
MKEIFRDIIKLYIRHNMINATDLIPFIKSEQINTEMTEMYKEGLLVDDYERTCGLRVVEKEDVSGYDMEELRKYFKKKYCGYTGYSSTKDHVAELVAVYMFKHPTHTFEMICEAGKKYVDYCLSKNQYVKKLNNFITDGDLESVVEDIIDGKTTETVFL